MNNFGEAARAAIQLIFGRDPELFAIVLLSLQVSLTATVIACAIGAPVGAALAMTRFPGRQGLIVLANALLGLPPVVVGLTMVQSCGVVSERKATAAPCA